MSAWSYFRLAAILCILVVASPASAESRLKICNKSKENLSIAVLEEMPNGFFKTRWEANGWISLKSGKCLPSSQQPGYQMVFLSIVSTSGAEPRILDFGVQKLPNRFTRTKTFGVERFYCVRSGKFTRSLAEIKMHTNCPAGYFKQLFNNFVWVSQNANFTLDIK